MSIVGNILNIFRSKEIDSLKKQVAQLQEQAIVREPEIQFGSRDEITVSRTSKPSPFSPYLVPWVPWGQMNLWPQQFKDLLTESPHYNRISTALANMVMGDGIEFEGPDARRAEVYFTEELGVDEKFIEKAAWDVVVFNGFSCQVLRDARQNVPARLVFQRIENVRSGKCNEYDMVDMYYIAKDWSLINTMGNVDIRAAMDSQFAKRVKENADYKTAYEVKEIPKYYIGSPEERSLICSFRYSPATIYYPVPLAEPAREWLKLQKKFIDFHNSVIDNGAAASAIMMVPFKETSDYEKDNNLFKKMMNNIMFEVSGTNNAGKLWGVKWDPGMDGKNPPPQIISPPIDANDKKYTAIMAQIQEQVFTALGVISPDLYGVATASGFASQADMLLTANKLTFTNIVQPLQRLILNPLNDILEHAGLNAEVVFSNSFPIDEPEANEDGIEQVQTDEEVNEVIVETDE